MVKKQKKNKTKTQSWRCKVKAFQCWFFDNFLPFSFNFILSSFSVHFFLSLKNNLNIFVWWRLKLTILEYQVLNSLKLSPFLSFQTCQVLLLAVLEWNFHYWLFWFLDTLKRKKKKNSSKNKARQDWNMFF